MAETPVTLTHELGTAGTMSNGMNWGGGWGGALLGGIIGFALAGAGGGGLFGRNGNVNTAIGLTNEAMLLKVQEDIGNMSNRISDNLCAGFSTVNNGISGINLELCKGFGALTHQIDMGLCDVKETIRTDGNATRALINDLVTQNLRERLNAAEGALSNANQTSTIVNALRPPPIPAFNVLPPNIPFGYGYGTPFAAGAPFGFNGCNPCNPCDKW